MEALVYKDKKMLRRGYTTGTCAALAAQGAVSFLVSGIWPETAEFMTPAGQMVRVLSLIHISQDLSSFPCPGPMEAWIRIMEERPGRP